MTRYIALLRGVNVNGRTIKSADLADVFRTLGFDDVKTVLASGNVAFDTDRSDAGGLKRDIEKALADRFGYDAWIVLVTAGALEAVVDAFPFDDARDGWHPYVLFASDDAAIDDLLASATDLDDGDDVVERGDHVVYWHNRRAVGVDSRFSKLAGKATYRSTTTNRNLRTLRKLL